MDKKALSESDLCDKCIRPAMERAGWHPLDQIYREFPLRAGRVVVRGKKHGAARRLRPVLQGQHPPGDGFVFHNATLATRVANLRQRLAASQSIQAYLTEALVSSVSSGLPVS